MSGGSTWYLGNDGNQFSFYGAVDNGVVSDLVPDVVIGDFLDGDTFSTAPGECLAVMREWSALDHSQTAHFGIDPDLCDVVVWVWYDLNPNYSAGAQNPALESNGQAYPFSITDIDWFQRGVGPIAHQGVKAEQAGAFDGPREDVSASFAIGTNYCVAGINSTGEGALISAVGSRVVTEQNLILNASCCPDNVPGLFYFGPNAASGAAAFGNGFRCVRVPGSRRMYPLVHAGPSNGNPPGTAVLPVDFAAPYATSFVQGASLNFQFWYRDGMSGAGFNLTDGLNILFQ